MANVDTKKAVDTNERPSPKSVTIFGAGIAGLTAAHELVERGFDVQVIDPDIREHIHINTLDRGLGGMARSQWACSHQYARTETQEEEMRRFEPQARFLRDEVLVFDSLTKKPLDSLEAADFFTRAAGLIKAFIRVDDRIDLTRARAIQVGLPFKSVKGTTDYREQHFIDAVMPLLEPAEQPALKFVSFVNVVAKKISLREHLAPENTWLFINVSDLEILPSEHGFRFFPSFYRHIFDTFKRTPIRNPGEYERTHATTFDNLKPSESLGFLRAGETKGFSIPRSPIKSLEDGREYLRGILTEIGYESSDIKRYALKLLEYTTSCTKRRNEEYEHISWADFVEKEKYSEVSRNHLEFGPQMAAALRGSESDTRTQGTIFLQLHMDQMQFVGPQDCVLNGPTSTSWLNHWHDYLVSQGVAFVRGTLVDFARRAEDGKHKGRLYPRVVRTPAAVPYNPDAEIPVKVTGKYFVLALSLPAAAAVARRFIEVFESDGSKFHEDNDFSRTIDFAGDTSDDNLSKAIPDGPLQHLSGLQFYFDVPINFWRGHTLYLDSPWGLTSIGQTQFWGRPRNALDNYRGILSVDVGTWDQPYRTVQAWDATPTTLAAGTWAQIEDHHNNAFEERFGQGRKVPQPFAYAIDANLQFSADLRIIKDKTPFLVNRTGAFPKRPGRLIYDQLVIGDTEETSKQVAFFDVYQNYVFAGAFTKTYTRLTSMEAANESARHAVNAILRESELACENCTIWDPEDYEFPDLAWFRELDERRCEEGRPHFLKSMQRLSDLDMLCSPI